MRGMDSFSIYKLLFPTAQQETDQERDRSGYSEIWKWPVDTKFLKQKPLLASVLIHTLVSACFFVAVREHHDQKQPQ